MTRGGFAGRLVQLYVGLVAYGVSSALQVRAGLGLDPWDVFHQGVARRVGLSIGVVVILVGGLVLLGWIPLQQRPGLGTVSNVLVVGSALDAALLVLPTPHLLALRVGYLAVGIVLCAVATGMYIGARFGPGPRDGLMTGLAQRTGLSIRLTRTGIELTVLALGWLLGGSVGVGTLAFALSIGPLTQLFLRLFSARGTPAVPHRAGRALPSSHRTPVRPVVGGDGSAVLVLVVRSGQPGGQPVDGGLELRAAVDEPL